MNRKELKKRILRGFAYPELFFLPTEEKKETGGSGTFRIRTNKKNFYMEFTLYNEAGKLTKPTTGFLIDWGDGNKNTETSHTYANPIAYIFYSIKITVENPVYFMASAVPAAVRSVELNGNLFPATSAFYNCYNLETVSAPDLIHIPDSAFDYCTALTKIDFPKCETIGDSAFSGCKTLTQVSFPKCTRIGFVNGYAFQNCTALTDATFPLCKYVLDRSFAYCTSLTAAIFADGCVFGEDVFLDCNNLDPKPDGSTN